MTRPITIPDWLFYLPEIVEGVCLVALFFCAVAYGFCVVMGIQ